VRRACVTASNPFEWRHYPGDIILWRVRWYLRFPISCAHMAERALERGLLIHSSCIWRWVQIYGPELDKRCRAHLKPTNKSYRVDETSIRIKGQDKYLYRAVNSAGADSPQNTTWRQLRDSSVRRCSTQPIRQEPSVSG
jgi:transposase-like protein